MSKIRLDRLTSQFGFQAAFNSVLQDIEDEFSNRVLYRNNPVGEANQMYNDLDMGNHDLLNVNSVSAKDFRINGQDITESIKSLADQVAEAAEDAEAAADQAADSAVLSEASAVRSEAAAEAAENKLFEIVSVKDYGAVGDGVTDDTAAIQAAFDDNVQSVYFPAGTYLTSANLTIKRDGFHIFGVGDASTIKVADNVQRVNGIDSVGYDDLLIEKIRIDHNAQRGGIFSRHAPAAAITANSGMTVNGTFAIGSTTINVAATTLTGSINTGDTFKFGVDTTVYTVTNSVTAVSNALTGITFTPALVAQANNGVTFGIYQYPRYKAKTSYPIGTTTLTFDCARIVANPASFDATAIRPGEQFQFMRRVEGSMLEYEVDPTHTTVYTVTSPDTPITVAGIGNEFQNFTITPPLTKAIDKFTYTSSIQDANNRYWCGIYMGNSSRSRIDNVTIENTPFHAIMVGTGPITAIGQSEGGNLCSVTNCRINYFGGAGIGMARTRKTISANNKITVCYTNVGSGIQYDDDCDECTISSNVIGDVLYGVMTYSGNSATITSNTIADTVIGILTDATSESISIVGNSILGTGKSSRGIMCRVGNVSGSGIVFSNISITGNVIKNIVGPGGIGINLAQASVLPTTTQADDTSNISITGNCIYNTVANGMSLIDTRGVAASANTIMFAGNYGLYAENNQMLALTGNVIRNSGSSGIYIKESDIITLSGNIAKKIPGSTTTMTYGLEFGANVTNVKIDASNSLDGNGVKWFSGVLTPLKGRLYGEGTIDFPSIAPLASATASISVPGVTSNDSCTVIPPASGIGTLMFIATAGTNVVNVRAFNYGAAAVDAGAGLFSVAVDQWEKF